MSNLAYNTHINQPYPASFSSPGSAFAAHDPLWQLQADADKMATAGYVVNKNILHMLRSITYGEITVSVPVS